MRGARETPGIEMTTFHRPPDLVQATEILRGGVKPKAPDALAEAAKPIVQDMSLPAPTQAFPTSAGNLDAERLSGIIDAVGKVGQFVGAKGASKAASPSDAESAKKTLAGEMEQIKTKYRSEIESNRELLNEARQEIESALTGKDQGALEHFGDLFNKFLNLGSAGKAIAMIGTILILGFAGSAAALSAPWFGVAAIAVGLVGAFGGVGLEAFKQKFPEQFKKMSDALPQSIREFIAPKRELQAVSPESLSKKKEAKGGLKRAADDLTQQKQQLKEAKTKLSALKGSLEQALNFSDPLQKGALNQLISDLSKKQDEGTQLSPDLAKLLSAARKSLETSAGKESAKGSSKLAVAELRKSLTDQLEGAIDSLEQHRKDLDALIGEAQDSRKKASPQIRG